MLVGWGSARNPFFAGLGIPSFAWLVLGMLAFELVAGLVLKAHPSTILSMGWRIAGLLVSFAVCYASVGILKAA